MRPRHLVLLLCVVGARQIFLTLALANDSPATTAWRSGSLTGEKAPSCSTGSPSESQSHHCLQELTRTKPSPARRALGRLSWPRPLSTTSVPADSTAGTLHLFPYSSHVDAAIAASWSALQL